MLPTLWVDVVQMGVRPDGLATLRFYTLLPELMVEACRIQTPTDHLKRMLDGFAQALNYYPTAPNPQQPK
jgi:hypothetical protein